MREGGACIRQEKRFNLQSVKLAFFPLFAINHVFQHFSRRARCEICLKLTIKTQEYVKLTIKLKQNKDTVDFVLASLLLTLNTFTSCYIVSIVDFDQLIAG